MDTLTSGNSPRSWASTSPMPEVRPCRLSAHPPTCAPPPRSDAAARAEQEHQAELAHLDLVTAAQVGLLDPLTVHVGAVQAADVADGEPAARAGRTRRAAGRPSRRRGRCRCPGGGRPWSGRCPAGTCCPRSGRAAPRAARCPAAGPPGRPDRRAAPPRTQPRPVSPPTAGMIDVVSPAAFGAAHASGVPQCEQNRAPSDSPCPHPVQ